MTTIKNMQKMKVVGFYVAAMALLLTAGTANAQTADLGVKAGVNFGSLRTNAETVSGASGKTGLHVGLFARTGGNFYFQPELNFSTFGGEYVYDGETNEPMFRQLNIPLMAGYKLIDNGQVNFRVSLGPDVNFNLNKPDAPTGTDYKRFSVGGVLNAGVDMGRVTFDARYSLGLTTVHEALDQRPGVFSLSVGFKIL
jgi:hypothetical protein